MGRGERMGEIATRLLGEDEIGYGRSGWLTWTKGKEGKGRAETVKDEKTVWRKG